MQVKKIVNQFWLPISIWFFLGSCFLNDPNWIGVNKKGPWLVSSSGISLCAVKMVSGGCNLKTTIFGKRVNGTGGMIVPLSSASGPGCKGISDRCDSCSSCLAISACSWLDKTAAAPCCCWIKSKWTSSEAWRIARGTFPKRLAVPVSSCKICTCNAGHPFGRSVNFYKIYNNAQLKIVLQKIRIDVTYQVITTSDPTKA